uniref:Thioredoxin n=1 Tax=uncultured bacterium Contigcl_1748 TaxID=1393656 RepID=W0FM81_9BACT|nr:thioredoxin [uncultured bacterium Contigcl_1748]
MTLKMKNLALTLIVLAFALHAGAQGPKQLQISGVAPAATDSVLVIDMTRGAIRAKIPVRDGKFSTSIPAQENELLGIGDRTYFAPLFVDGTPVEVDLVAHRVKGSELNMMTNRCDNSLDSLDRVLAERMKTITENIADEAAARVQVAQLQEQRIVQRSEILKAYANTLVPAAFLPDMAMEMTYNQVEPWLKEGAPYMSHPRMFTAIRYAEGLKKKMPGLMFHELAMKDLDGNIRHLSEWCGKGNYVLVDFWASWCGPCRQEMPKVVESYVKYHGKGYEIVGVSFDTKEDAWKNAVKQMGMDWPQISDLKGWQSAGSDAYGVMAIPSNVLLDPEGRIIANDLRGDRLMGKLKEIYGF